MTLADLANIGELVGGLGVVASLLYLAVQIRQSSRIASFNAHQAVSESITGVMADVAKDPELFRVWREALASPENASNDDRERVGYILHQVFAAFENADRFGDENLRDRVRLVHERFLHTPAVQVWWTRQRDVFGEPFRSTIDARLKELASVAQAESGSRPAA